MRSFVSALALVISVNSFVPSVQLHAQDARFPSPGSSAVPSYEVPSGELHGIVIDESTGEPISGAQVTVEGLTLGNLTDAHGRFVVKRIPRGWHEIRAEFVGYSPGTLPVNMVPTVGWTARFSLTPSRVPLCGLLVCGPTVYVQVKDAKTSLAPVSQVVLRVATDSSSAWGFSTAEPGDSAAWVYASNWPGPISVEVAAERYAPWRLDDLTLERGECGCATRYQFRVWLLRTHNPDNPE